MGSVGAFFYFKASNTRSESTQIDSLETLEVGNATASVSEKPVIAPTVSRETSNEIAKEPISATDKWRKAFVSVYCTFGGNTGPIGYGIAYRKGEYAVAAIHTKTTIVVDANSKSYGPDDCLVSLHTGESFSVPNEDMIVIGRTDGSESVSLLSLHDPGATISQLSSSLEACTDFAIGGSVRVLGYEGAAIVEARSTILGTEPNYDQYSRLVISEPIPKLWNPAAVISSDNDCYLGVPSKDGSFVLPLITVYRRA